MDAVLLVLVALLGLAVGSFLNVVVWRVPRGASVVAPPSACPACEHPIRARDNVPVLSWVLLRARCRDCSAPISARYPAVELATGVLFVLAAVWVAGTDAGLWLLPLAWYVVAVGVALTLIDVDVHRLPDAIVLPSYPVVAVLLALASWGTGDWGALLRATLGGAVLWVAYLVMALVYPAGMGFGDVKLAGVLGAVMAWFGWGALGVGAFAAFALGGVYSLGLILARRAGRKSGIPFGPWMILGAVVGVLVGEPLWAAYLDAVLG